MLGMIIATGKLKIKKHLKNKFTNKDIQRDSFNGLGKPEPLKESLSGYWSRRIDGVNRIVYTIKDTSIIIIACRGHYK